MIAVGSPLVDDIPGSRLRHEQHTSLSIKMQGNSPVQPKSMYTLSGCTFGDRTRGRHLPLHAELVRHHAEHRAAQRAHRRAARQHAHARAVQRRVRLELNQLACAAPNGILLGGNRVACGCLHRQ